MFFDTQISIRNRLGYVCIEHAGYCIEYARIEHAKHIYIMYLHLYTKYYIHNMYIGPIQGWARVEGSRAHRLYCDLGTAPAWLRVAGILLLARLRGACQ